MKALLPKKLAPYAALAEPGLGYCTATHAAKETFAAEVMELQKRRMLPVDLITV